MPSARASSIGAALNWRLAVNGIHHAPRSISLSPMIKDAGTPPRPRPARAPQGRLNRSAHRDLRAIDVADAGEVHAVHFLRFLGEGQPELLAASIEFAEIIDSKAKLDQAYGIVLRCGVKRERRVAGREFAPEGGG